VGQAHKLNAPVCGPSLLICAAINSPLELTLILLMWKIWRAPNNASKWQMGFNLAFKGLISLHVSSDIIAHHQEFLNYFYSFW
jgi:hypothetical protein